MVQRSYPLFKRKEEQEMLESERLTGWIRTAIVFVIWFVLLLVLRSVVLSLRAVQTSGFAVMPFQSEVFPVGLPWIIIIDIAFLTVVIFSVLAFGGRLREALSSALPRLPRLGSIGYLITVLVAVIIGYFTYDDIILPPLYIQGVDWAYRLVFWLLVVGVSLGIVFELAQTLFAVRKETGSVIIVPGGSPKEAESSIRNCKECGTSLDTDDKYCRRCGARIQENEEQDTVENDRVVAP
jgi:uncharacterized paraquat-inducible protein A